jgi:hypothetical protein
MIAITASRASASSTARASFSGQSMLDVDPRTTIASRPLVLTACVVAFALAIATTTRLWTDVDNRPLMLVALLVLLVACVLLARASDSPRVEFSASTHTLIVALTCLAGLLSAAAQWHGNSYLRDDWGQLSLGIVLLAASPYRPVRHLLIAGAGSGAFVATLALFQSAELPGAMSPISFAIIAAVPVLSLSLAGAAYAHVVVRSGPRAVLPDQAYAGRATSANLRAVPTLAERAELINNDVEPFLRRIVNGDVISSSDTALAANIADSIRKIMVAEANRSWLGTVVADLDSRAAGPMRRFRSIEVHDPARLSDAMSFEQRTSVRAVLAVLLENPEGPISSPHRLSAFRATAAVLPGGHKRLLTHATFALPPEAGHVGRVRQRRASLRSIQRTLNPLLALTAGAFPWQDLIVDSSSDTIELTLRFSYGQEVERAVASDAV